jgi:hypothetical protein
MTTTTVLILLGVGVALFSVGVAIQCAAEAFNDRKPPPPFS